MTRLEPEAVIEIRDPTIDIPAIMDEIRAGLARRGYQDHDFDDAFPAFTPDGFPGPEWVARLQIDPELAYLLEQAAEGHDRIAVAMDVRAPQVPVGAGALLRLKRAAHELAVFYVNQLANRQVQVNTHLVRAVARLAADQAALRRENASLREQLDELRGRPSENVQP
jgi:hypothetical protein